MRIVFTTLMVILFSASQTWAIEKPELDRRVQKYTAKFAAMQAKIDKAIPADTLRKARGIVLLDRTKAGFIFAYQGGGGVAIVKDKRGDWGPVAFLEASEASLGFQVGGQQSFLVMLLMNDDVTKALAESNFEFGGEARGTAGDSSAGAEGTVKNKEQAVLIYHERSGLFGGAAIKGGTLAPDSEANHAYYGEILTVKDILFDGKVKPSKTATDLAKKLDENSTGK